MEVVNGNFHLLRKYSEKSADLSIPKFRCWIERDSAGRDADLQ